MKRIHNISYSRKKGIAFSLVGIYDEPLLVGLLIKLGFVLQEGIGRTEPLRRTHSFGNRQLEGKTSSTGTISGSVNDCILYTL